MGIVSRLIGSLTYAHKMVSLDCQEGASLCAYYLFSAEMVYS